ncbi:response regulator [Asticcacaulis sp. 201]|uniref:response regulator n=1 Tax=Asticcacaulis sp. 201 TaxID=3028787 RepID=UPI002916B633|nr:response regulator [Asticcacaulis sp. 201]MDV6331820.1 response regulator [Asticcacaulis sp. 201]
MSTTDGNENRAALRVLIVEDNLAAAQTTGWMIEELGHDYHMVHSAEQALEEAASYAPDIALLDISLPGLNGFDLCQALRALPGFERTVFVAQTGWAGDTFRHRAADAGFHHYIAKPFVIETLMAILDDSRAR